MIVGKWYIVRTQPRAEALAAAEFDREGIETFCPRIAASGCNARKGWVPLFPGYLFLRSDGESDGLPTFRPSHRVFNWVRFGSEIPSVPDQLIEALRVRTEAINQVGGLYPDIKLGDVVYVTLGNMESLAEVLTEPKSPRARVHVLMKFLGRLVDVEVSANQLNVAENRQLLKAKLPRRSRGRNRPIRKVNGFAQ